MRKKQSKRQPKSEPPVFILRKAKVYQRYAVIVNFQLLARKKIEVKNQYGLASVISVKQSDGQIAIYGSKK